MKRKITLSIIVTSVIFFTRPIIINAQWNVSWNGTNYFGQIDPTTNVESIGIGYFSGIGLYPYSALHINTNLLGYLANPPTYNLGEVFRTDCPVGNNDISTYWRMFRQGQEYGRLGILSEVDEAAFMYPYVDPHPGANFYIQSSYTGDVFPLGDLRFNTPGYSNPIGFDATPRMRILGITGFVGIGDYRYFIPQNLLHLHVPSFNSDPPHDVYEQFTNDNTTATDDVQGFKIGITYNISSTFSDAELLSQQQGAHMNFYTNGSGVVTNPVRITAGGDVGVNTTTPNSKVEINSGSANVSGLQFTNLTSSSAATIAPFGKVLTVASDGKVALTDILSTCGGGVTTNYITKTTGTNTICNSAIWENSTSDHNVGIGTVSPISKLHVSAATSTASYFGDTVRVKL